MAEYLATPGLQKDLDKLGFNLVGFGCTTCIGNSGPLPEEISKSINDNGLIAAAVLSGNRNFEGRVSPDVQANYLASPPLVVAYALAGTVQIDLTKEPLGTGKDGKPVFLKDIWPTPARKIQGFIDKYRDERKTCSSRNTPTSSRATRTGSGIKTSTGQTYAWDNTSTYVQNPPYFQGMKQDARPASPTSRAPASSACSATRSRRTISRPAGSIKAASPAGKYLMENGVEPADFNQYGTRRGNHEVMMRGTFANIRLKNHMMGPMARGRLHHPLSDQGRDADLRRGDALQGREACPLVVFAGVEYGNGSSRDWAAKGTNLLGVKAVIAQSFERIHRSNLVGMGVVAVHAGGRRHLAVARPQGRRARDDQGACGP